MIKEISEIRKWYCRLNNVNFLIDWVTKNMNNPNKYKASQYVYSNLIIGKMLYPDVDNNDPLFTFEPYMDNSMMQQLKEGKYKTYMKKISLIKKNLIKEYESEDMPRITWKIASEGLNKTSLLILQKLQDELCKSNNTKISKIGRNKNKFIQEQMICLVLRYKCIGGFENKLHGSITKKISNNLKDYIECFASPLNHKLDKYFSMFEEDKIFGSSGNFFKFIKENNNTLPSGLYEINPPFINEIFEKITEIISNSLNTSNKFTIIFIAPNWKNTKYVKQLDGLILKPKLKKYSSTGIKLIKYINDTENLFFRVKTKYWIISSMKHNLNIYLL